MSETIVTERIEPNLRFVVRHDYWHAVTGEERTVRILQQLWATSDGHIWRDVPEVREEATGVPEK